MIFALITLSMYLMDYSLLFAPEETDKFFKIHP